MSHEFTFAMPMPQPAGSIHKAQEAVQLRRSRRLEKKRQAGPPNVVHPVEPATRRATRSAQQLHPIAGLSMGPQQSQLVAGPSIVPRQLQPVASSSMAPQQLCPVAGSSMAFPQLRPVAGSSTATQQPAVEQQVRRTRRTPTPPSMYVIYYSVTYLELMFILQRRP